VVTTVDTAALRRLLDDGAVLLEVLTAEDFGEEHLPGARLVPLDALDDEAVGDLDRARPVVVYGFDSEDDRGARAAAGLEALGFEDVHHYAIGKIGWLAEGGEAEGRRRPEQRVAWIARDDVPVLAGDATVADATAVFGPEDDVAVVLDPDRVVLGLVRREVLGLPGETPIADVLQPGPSTFRPSMTIRELVGYFRSSDEARAIVSTLDGTWIGLIRRADVLDG
jgi:rhodanese-related sulfurtransferase